MASSVCVFPAWAPHSSLNPALQRETAALLPVTTQLPCVQLGMSKNPWVLFSLAPSANFRVTKLAVISTLMIGDKGGTKEARSKYTNKKRFCWVGLQGSASLSLVLPATSGSSLNRSPDMAQRCLSWDDLKYSSCGDSVRGTLGRPLTNGELLLFIMFGDVGWNPGPRS